jgi:hypothetical protein
MDDIAFRLLDYVCQNISYESDYGEWWEWPAVTLCRKSGDCEDTVILLASMLRGVGYSPDRVYVCAGTWRGLKHAWGELDGEILETTYTAAGTVPDPHNYRWLVKFNDVQVIERYPGAISQLFQLARDEGLKLSLMENLLTKR